MRRVSLLLLPLLLLVPACSGGGGDSYRVTAWFERAVSLYPKSDVRVLGLPAGEVKDVDIVGSRVKVVMEVKGDIPVPADVRATIVPLSLIGERYVQLFPAWKEGQPRLPRGATIPIERTDVPVEPDEALAALKEFLDTLDPKATGRLVQNLADDLDGAGGDLNRALEGLGQLMGSVADKDAELGRIIDQFDNFTTTLRTREAQLGRVMDSFADLTSLLAEERRAVESLVRGLGQVSTEGLDLVSEHGARLDRDLTILTRTLQSVRANLDSVRMLLESGPVLAAGLHRAHDPELHRIDLRSQYTPTAQQALKAVFDPLGIPVGDVVCVPADVGCTPAPSQSAASPLPGAPALPAPAGPVPAAVAPAGAPSSTASTSTSTTTPGSRTPVDDIVDLLGAPSSRDSFAAVRPPRSIASRVGGALGGAGRFVRGAAHSLLGAVR